MRAGRAARQPQPPPAAALAALALLVLLLPASTSAAEPVPAPPAHAAAHRRAAVHSRIRPAWASSGAPALQANHSAPSTAGAAPADSALTHAPPVAAEAAAANHSEPGAAAEPALHHRSAGSGAGGRPPPSAQAGGEELAVFVGVMSGARAERRALVRATWFGAGLHNASSSAASAGVMLRFILGHFEDGALQAALAEEAAAHGDVLRVDVLESYDSLVAKTLLFFQVAYKHSAARYIMKVDDDIYLRVPALPLAAAQWAAGARDYIGCMFLGGKQFADGRYLEPVRELTWNHTYDSYASGGAYVLSRRAAAILARAAPGDLRFGAGEDTSMGLWMLAANVTFLNDDRLCSYECKADAIVVTNGCNGLCGELAVTLPALHADPACASPPDAEFALPGGGGGGGASRGGRETCVQLHRLRGRLWHVTKDACH